MGSHILLDAAGEETPPPTTTPPIPTGWKVKSWRRCLRIIIIIIKNHSGASLPTGAIRRGKHEKPAMIQGGAMAWSTCLACKRPRFETPLPRSCRKASAGTQPSALSNFLRPGRKKKKKNHAAALLPKRWVSRRGRNAQRGTPERRPAGRPPSSPPLPPARPAGLRGRVTRASPPLTSRGGGGRRRGRGREGRKEEEVAAQQRQQQQQRRRRRQRERPSRRRRSLARSGGPG